MTRIRRFAQIGADLYRDQDTGATYTHRQILEVTRPSEDAQIRYFDFRETQEELADGEDDDARVAA